MIGLGLGIFDVAVRRAGLTSQTAAVLATLRSGASQLIMHPLEYGSMFQDRAGTVPVTASGQLVGLALDWGFTGMKPEPGPELITNGDFSAGVTGWEVTGEDATHIATFTDGKLRYRSDTTSPTLSVVQPSILTIGKTYLVDIVTSAWVSGSLKSDSFGQAILSSGVGTKTMRLVATATTLSLARSTTNVDLTIDNISVRELPGYHATAISDSARGILRDVGGKRWVEYNGVNTAYQTPVLPAPGVDKAQVFAGLRKLSDAATGMMLELSINSGGNNGALYLTAPNFTGAAGYEWRSRGATAVQATAGSGYPAPITNVLSGLGDIAGDIAMLRVDGTQVAQSTADQGTGNFNPAGTYPLYYGARAGTSLFFNGHHYRTLGPIVRFGTNATPEQIAAAEAYYTAGLPV